MVRGERAENTPVIVRDSAWTHVIVWIGFPVGGALLVWALKLAAGWVASLPWAPFQGPFELVASIPEPLATLGALAIGAAAGLVIAVLAAQDSLTVSIEPAVATPRTRASCAGNWPSSGSWSATRRNASTGGSRVSDSNVGSRIRRRAG